MGPFWGSFFEQLRGCGRSTAMFLMIFAGVLVLGVVWSKVESREAKAFIAGAIFAPLMLRLLVALIRARSRSRYVHRRELLSAHDRKVAREKLKPKPPVTA